MNTCHTSRDQFSSDPAPYNPHLPNDSFRGKPCDTRTGINRHASSSKDTLEKASALVDNNGRPIVLLKLYKPPVHPARFPSYYEGEEIVGNVELNLIKPENVEEITLSVKGTLVGLTRNPKPFVEVTERLWEASQLDQSNLNGRPWAGAISAQLKGYFNWPFSLKLPTHVSTADTSSCNQLSAQSSRQLPPSFSASNSRSSIDYAVSVNIKGRRNFALSAPFIYTPTIRPPCISSPNNLSCIQALDEDRWEVFRTFSIRGIAFATYTVDISCTLALAKPLFYTRGAVIPCVLAIESADANVIELLASTRAPCVHLYRHVEDTGSGLETKITRLWDSIKQPSTVVGSAIWCIADDASEERSAEMYAAVCAVKSSLRGDMHSRTLYGKIPLAADLAPSFSCGKLSVDYELQMLPFKVAGYVPEDGDKAIFFHKIVRIASAPALPMPSRPHSSSVASSRSSPLHRPSQVPLPPSRPATPARSSTPRLDRPLPSIPCLPPYEQLENVRRLDLKVPVRDSTSESENTALRRAATAPRVPPRSPFPTRQCTR